MGSSVDLGRRDEARNYFERAMTTANDLGLFAEEYDVDSDRMLGNVPQALSHLSQLAAVHALAEPSLAPRSGPRPR
jgi:GH15 family glucan-1,4-alpha-glucosidase